MFASRNGWRSGYELTKPTSGESHDWHIEVRPARVALLTRVLPVSFIVEFDGADDGEIVFVAQQEIEVLRLNAVEGALPMTTAQTALRFHDIGDPNFSEDSIVVADRLIQNSEK